MTWSEPRFVSSWTAIRRHCSTLSSLAACVLLVAGVLLPALLTPCPPQKVSKPQQMLRAPQTAGIHDTEDLGGEWVVFLGGGDE